MSETASSFASDTSSKSSPAQSASSFRNTIDLWVHLKRTYGKLRGVTEGPNHKAIPQTTYRDVMEIALVWQKEFAKVSTTTEYDKRELSRLGHLMDEIAADVDHNRLDSVYGHNVRFWEQTQRVAMYLESRKVRPSDWSLVKEAAVEAMRETPAKVTSLVDATRSVLVGLFAEPIRLAVLVGVILCVPMVWKWVRS